MSTSKSTGKKTKSKRRVSVDSEDDEENDDDLHDLRGAYKPVLPMYHFHCCLKLGNARTLKKADINQILHDSKFSCSIPDAKNKTMDEVMEYVMCAMNSAGIFACASHFELAEHCGRGSTAIRFNEATFKLAAKQWKADVGGGRNKIVLCLKQQDFYRKCAAPWCTLNVTPRASATAGGPPLASGRSKKKSRFELSSRNRESAMKETSEIVMKKMGLSGADKVKQRLARVSGVTEAQLSRAIGDPSLLDAPVIKSGLLQTVAKAVESSTIMPTASSISSSSSSSSMPAPIPVSQNGAAAVQPPYAGYQVSASSSSGSSRKRSLSAMKETDEEKLNRLLRENDELRRELASKK